MGVHRSTKSETILVQESLCELGISFPEGKMALNGLEKCGRTPGGNTD